MSVSVVNPTERPQELDLSLVGAQASGPTKVYQLAAPATTTPAPAASGWGAFGGPPATMAESSLPKLPRRITLPAASLTVYEFDVR
jgi:hypothetical protein